MFKLAFSTVACPDRTLEEAFALAAEAGYDGLELRTLGGTDPTLLCAPCLTGADKIRRLAVTSGVELACLSTSHRFDAPIWPPVLGRALPSFTHRARPAQRDVDAADDMGCSLVRVFGFEVGGRERRTSTLTRIAERMAPVLDTGRARRTNIVIENGGSFTTAADLAAIFQACEQHPNLRAAYDLTVGMAAGDTLQSAFDTLGQRLVLLRLRPVDDAGLPRPLTPADAHSIVPVLLETNFQGWISVDWPVCWSPQATGAYGNAAEVLAKAADAIRSAMPTERARIPSPRVAVGI